MLKAAAGTRVYRAGTDVVIARIKSREGLIIQMVNESGADVQKEDVAFRLVDQETGVVFYAIRTPRGEEFLYAADHPWGPGLEAYPA